jgi:pilus assembly protein CpaB
MSNVVLRIVAIVLAIGALIMGYLGYKLSQVPQTPAASNEASLEIPNGEDKAPTPTYPVVFALRDLPRGSILTDADVTLWSLPVQPADGFANLEEVQGQVTTQPVRAGDRLLRSHFETGHGLAQQVGADERAVAIKVNEVISTGGFIVPGDRVDVLLYIPRSRETEQISSAQLLLSGLRVLALGEQFDQNPSSSGDMATAVETGKKSRTAVLAVPAVSVSRLMLAAQIGDLRLALRGDHGTVAEQRRPSVTGDSEKQYVTLKQLLKSQPKRVYRAAPTVTVYQGDQAQAVTTQ